MHNIKSTSKLSYILYGIRKLVYLNEKYSRGEETCSDFGYDTLYALCSAWAKKHNLRIHIPNQAHVNTVRIKHIKPFLSLNKVYNNKDLNRWLSKIQGKISVEYKFDGIACEIYYLDGVLQYISSRGDGVFGDNIFNKSQYISGIPKSIPYQDKLYIRGELIIMAAELLKYPEYCNKTPRGAILSILKSHNISGACPNIQFFAYHVDMNEARGSRISAMRRISQYGVSTIMPKFIPTPLLSKYIKKFNRVRFDMPFHCDGLVFKSDNIAEIAAMGNASSYPKWAMAFKLASPSAISKVVDILYDVGRTGVITPTAGIEPIVLLNSSIKRVSVHNIARFLAFNIGIGSNVEITKAGDIVPYILKVHSSNDVQPVALPNECPNCHFMIQRTKSELVCTNLDCQGRIIAQMKYAGSRGLLELDGVSSAKYLILNNVLGVKNIYQLIKYDVVLLKKKIMGTPLFAVKSIDNLVQSIINCRRKYYSMHILYASLGASNLGPMISQKLIEYGHSQLLKLLNYINAPYGSRHIIPGIDIVQFNNIRAGLAERYKDVYDLWSCIKRGYLKIELVNMPIIGDIVITGSFSMPRAYFVTEIRKMGYVVRDHITKNTLWLLVGLAPGSVKISQAHKYLTPSGDWDHFLKWDSTTNQK
jgi:DNA ligase (NAD+)